MHLQAPPRRRGADPLGRSRLPDGLQRPVRVPPPRTAPRLTVAVTEVPEKDGQPVRHPRDRAQRPRHRVQGEAARAGDVAARVDGRLPVRPRGADPLAGRGRRDARTRRTTSARTCCRAWWRAARACSRTGSRTTGRTSARSTRTTRRTSRSSATSRRSTCTIPSWVMHTQSADRPPVRFESGARVDAQPDRERLPRRGRGGELGAVPGRASSRAGAVVRDSIVMHDTVIGARRRARPRHRRQGSARSARGARVGHGDEMHAQPRLPRAPLERAGAWWASARGCPQGIIVGRNARIGAQRAWSPTSPRRCRRAASWTGPSRCTELGRGAAQAGPRRIAASRGQAEALPASDVRRA